MISDPYILPSMHAHPNRVPGSTTAVPEPPRGPLQWAPDIIIADRKATELPQPVAVDQCSPSWHICEKTTPGFGG